MKNAKFSVIIPFFNSQEYIERAIYSIINQTYINWELILINDGSSDNSEKIVQDVINKNKGSFIYRKTSNLGPSSARNLGLSLASGQYVCFLDSDDEYDITLFDKIAKLDQDFDVCFFGWKEIYENGKIDFYDKRFEFLDKSERGYDVCLKKMQHVLWLCNCNEVYNRELLLKNKIEYPVGIFSGEDACFIYKSLVSADKVISLNENLFVNYIRQSSLMRAKITDKNLTEFTAILTLIDFIKHNQKLSSDKKTFLTNKFMAYYDYVRISIAKKLSCEYSLTKYFAFRKRLKNILPRQMNKMSFNKKYLNKKSFYQCVLFKWFKLLFFIICKIKYKKEKL